MTTATADTHKAYKLEPGYAEQGFSGGSIAGPLGETIDLKALLDDTDHGNVEGVIVTADPSILNSLQGLPMFEETAIPDSFDPPAVPGDEPLPDLDTLRKQQLVTLADERGLDTSGTVADLTDRIRGFEAARGGTAVLVGADSVNAQFSTPGALRQDGTVTDGAPATDPEPVLHDPQPDTGLEG